jgi:NADH-quinone oxidoreductase subunit A
VKKFTKAEAHASAVRPDPDFDRVRHRERGPDARRFPPPLDLPPHPVKIAPYESGMPVLGNARERFSVKFYLVAMLFIIFDIETVFMIPWAVAFRQLQELAGLLIIEMVVFIVILAVGYVYIWKRGALQWD